jgi:hypothetical protein
VLATEIRNRCRPRSGRQSGNHSAPVQYRTEPATIVALNPAGAANPGTPYEEADAQAT